MGMDWFKIINGVNTDQLFQDDRLSERKPGPGPVYISGPKHLDKRTHNRAMVKGFYGALQEG